MSFENIIREIKKKEVKPIYFLSGDEAYYIDYISDFIEENLIPEEDRAFNQSVFYGKDVDLQNVINLAKQFPMMGDRQLIIVREAQDIRNFEPLELYLKQPQATTVLVFCYKGKTLDKRKTISKVIDKTGVLFESKKLYDNQIPEWIVRYVEGKDFKIAPKASVLLSEFLGNELSKITNEVDKLCILLPAGSQITPEVIEKNVGISKDYNIFELNNALGSKDVEKVMRIVHYFAANPKSNPLVVTLSTLHGFFLKVMVYHFSPDKNPETLAATMKVSRFFIKDYQLAAKNYPPKKISQVFELLNEYDLKSKGVNNPSTSEGELLKELAYKILR
ncbi:MAG: DNA polymerase III subunit delta [Flavobacteriales bacterium]